MQKTETKNKHMAEAKQTKTAAAPAGAQGNTSAQEQAAAARAAKEAAAAKDRFVYVGAPTKKVAPQAQTIINAVEAGTKQNKDGISRDELVKKLTGVLQTRQPVGRIVSYYQKLIQEVGAVKIVRASA